FAPARLAEVEELNTLVRESVRGLSTADSSPEQLASSLKHLFGIDTRLIEDGTYYVIEESGRPIACGGWSRRRTLFGGDQYADRSDDRLDPRKEAARIRAFFVHPSQARRGLASRILDECERAARAEGFRRLELMSTLPGEPFYARRGFRVLERVDLELPDGVRFPLARMERVLWVLRTRRLVLRRLSIDDAPFILELVNEPSWLRFIGDKGVRTLEDAQNYIRQGPIDMYERLGFGMYLTELKTDGTPIGICGLIKRDALEDVDVGFANLPRFWGKGYAYEAASAVMNYGKKVIGLKRIVAVTAPGNAPSVRLLEKLGLRFERRVRLAEDGPEVELFGSPSPPGA